MAELERGATAPPLPTENVDWTPSQWERYVTKALTSVSNASTAWNDRTPLPTGEHVLGPLRSLPDEGAPIDEILARIDDEVIPAAAFNGHPRWLAYITAAPLPIGVVGEFIASALNQNTALWRIAPGATRIELETLAWIRDLVGMPEGTEGTFVSGGQMANIVAHAVARDAQTPWDQREFGLRGPDGAAPPLRIYASDEAHYCHAQAAELLGLGRSAVRRVPVDQHYRLRVDALAQMVAADRTAGALPITVVGTAGTVGTGAVDPLPAIRDFCRREALWFHIDGAYGAFAALAESRPTSLDAIGDADSLACDPHKWLYAPIDAGVTLIRDGRRLERSFAFHASYLHSAISERGPDLLERSPENTRPFRALKVWLMLQACGRRGYAQLIEGDLRLAAHMASLIKQTPTLELAATRDLSIVCWRVVPPGRWTAESLNAIQDAVIDELAKRGIASISNARLANGDQSLRACIVNFRTTAADLEAIVSASEAIGRELMGMLVVAAES